MKRLVSVVIPTYGKPTHLKRAIESVFKQDYSPIELVVVDDNGKGTEYQLETERIINESILENFRIKYICHEINKNGSAARNTGIRMANGYYIALLDDDDIFLPQKISTQIKALDLIGEELKVCYCSFCIFFPDGRKKEVIAKPIDDISLGILNNSLEIPSSTLVFTKAAWEYIGGFDESYKRHQDWEFVIRLAQSCKFTYVEEVGMNRIITGRNSPKNPLIYQEYKEYFLDKMNYIISKYPKEIQQKIMFKHNMDITFQYFKSKNISSGINRLIKSGYIVSGVLYVFRRIYRYLVFRFSVAFCRNIKIDKECDI